MVCGQWDRERRRTITLPKTEEAKPKSIQVRSGAGQRGQAQDIEIASR